jgi:hypothetical protein
VDFFELVDLVDLVGFVVLLDLVDFVDLFEVDLLDLAVEFVCANTCGAAVKAKAQSVSAVNSFLNMAIPFVCASWRASGWRTKKTM